MLTTLLTSGLMLTYSGGVAHVRIVDHLGPFDTKLDYLGPASTAKTAKGTVQVIPLK